MTTFVRTFAPTFPALSNHFLNEKDLKTSNFTPAVNVIENENEFELQLAAPGLKKEDFELKVHDQTFSISVSKKEETDESSLKFSRKEFDFSNFKRSFTLPKTIDFEKINAVYQDGILLVSLPKLAITEPRAISVH